MKELKLKPCPFCNGNVLEIYLDYMIHCKKCETLFAQPRSKNPKSMIAVWNDRKENQNERNQT